MESERADLNRTIIVGIIGAIIIISTLGGASFLSTINHATTTGSSTSQSSTQLSSASSSSFSSPTSSGADNSSGILTVTTTSEGSFFSSSSSTTSSIQQSSTTTEQSSTTTAKTINGTLELVISYSTECVVPYQSSLYCIFYTGLLVNGPTVCNGNSCEWGGIVSTNGSVVSGNVGFSRIYGPIIACSPTSSCDEAIDFIGWANTTLIYSMANNCPNVRMSVANGWGLVLADTQSTSLAGINSRVYFMDARYGGYIPVNFNPLQIWNDSQNLPYEIVPSGVYSC